mgnify:CR=1 FL=1
MHDTPSRVQDLSTVLCTSILNSLPIDQDMEHFAHSTLGMSPAEALHLIAEDPDHPEGACFLDLILSPRMDQRIQLEKTLEGSHLSPSSLDQLIQVMVRKCPSARVKLPRGNDVPLELSQEMIGTLVHRLRLDKPVPAGLEQALQAHVPATWHPFLRARLRLAAWPLIGSREEFLSAVLSHVSTASPLFQACFDFALAFVQECSSEEDMAQALVNKRDYLEHSLDKAAFLEKQRNRHAMETLLMQRLPMLSIDVRATRETIAIIDDLNLALYGRIPGNAGPAWPGRATSESPLV